MNDDGQSINNEAGNDLSQLAIRLLRGMLFRDNDPRLWESLIDLQIRVREYMDTLQLDLTIDEAEGYAFLHSRTDEVDKRWPRLIARHPLSFRVSLLLALLRRKLVEFDATGGETRLVLSREEISEMVRLFLPDDSNEVRLMERLDTDLNRIVDLGFLRRMNVSGSAVMGTRSFEVQRFLRAFVDAQWLAEFDARLAGYRAKLEESSRE